MLELQAHRLQVSQAVAQAVATQKQLEQELQKNKDQADTWLERAKMAEAQRNPELAVQARQRMEQYSRAAQELQENLTSHTENTMTLRKHLTEVESKIGCRQANAPTTKSQGTDQKSYVPMPGDSVQTQLEGTYQNLESSLIQIRHTMATAIATEKQLEQRLQKNKEQANTWMERASMAEQQKNSELVEQARQRMEQYVLAAGELQEQLLIQKESTSTLRQRLSDLEREVQKAYTKKQVLISRDKAAKATLKANESLERIDIIAALSALKQMEIQLIEQEKAAGASMTVANAVDTPIDRQFLADAIATFETAIEAIRQLDQRIADKDTSKKQTDFE
jgi:phage shock protein A